MMTSPCNARLNFQHLDLQQRIEHLLDGRHHSRVRRIRILQREQVRHLLVDVDAGLAVELRLQRAQHHVLAVGDLLGSIGRLTLGGGDLLREIRQRRRERRRRRAESGRRRIQRLARGELLIKEVRPCGVTGRRRAAVLHELGGIADQLAVDPDARRKADRLLAAGGDRAGIEAVAVGEQRHFATASLQRRHGRGHRRRVHGRRSRPVVEHPQRAAGVGELQVGRPQRRIELAGHRGHAAGEVDADHLVVGIGGGAVGERQHRGIVDPHQRQLMLDVAGVGVGDMHRVAALQAGQIEVEAARRARAHRRARCGLVRQQARHVGGELVELGLRLHQGVVAHVQIAGDGARTDRIGLDHVE